MRELQEDASEFDENTDEVMEEYPEKEIVEEANQEKGDVPDVWWTEEIRKIEDPELREKAIEAPEKLKEKKETWIKSSSQGRSTKSITGAKDT